jgi:hypothetical protein
MLKDYFPKQWQSYIDLDKLDPIDGFLEEETKTGQDWHPQKQQIFLSNQRCPEWTGFLGQP